MIPLLNTFYGGWRLRAGIVPALNEKSDSPPEYLLQAAWQHQRLTRDSLKLSDGQRVHILHPGFKSVEGGPDFRGAVIQFSDLIRSGDVEIDIRPSGWHSHGHDKNPAFKSVVLHVVWDTEKNTSSGIPCLPLKTVLDSPIGELNVWFGTDGSQTLPENLRGKCCAPLREMKEEDKQALLREAAAIRLQAKAAQFKARAKQAGWDQALWEGLFRALGYKHNSWPMQRVAELRPRWSGSEDPLRVQARLFGISGLLPGELTRTRANTDNYLRQIWDHWWRERDEFSDCVLPKDLWRFHGLRPANHPQRRLGLASRWPANGSLASGLERWCRSEIDSKQLVVSLLEVLQTEPDEFWSWHCTFRSAKFKKPQPLIGSTRATDIAINIVLPWLWIRALDGKNEKLRNCIEKRYFEWPAAEDNSLLRLARERLLGGASKKALPTAASQQGLIQIVHDFCDRSNALCENCRFPNLVEEWRRSERPVV